MQNRINEVFPMYVGVILKLCTTRHLLQSIPHVCGGDPKTGELTDWDEEYSPCMWG